MALPLTVAGIKARLVGLDSWLAAAATSMAAYDDDRIEHDIPARVRMFERETQWRVNPVQVVSDADSEYAVGDSYIVEGRYPYYQQIGVEQFMVTTLKSRPVRAIQRVRIFLGAQPLLTIPSNWINYDARTGRMWLLPIAGSALVSTYASSWAAFTMGLAGRDILPNAISIDYTAGLPDTWDTRQTAEWSDLIEVLEEYCALRVLYDIGELYDAGMMGKSIGADGASQSVQYSRFQQRKQELDAHVREYQAMLREQEAPITMTAV